MTSLFAEELEGDSAFRLIKTGPFGNCKCPLSERYHYEKVKEANNLKVIKQTPKAANQVETKDTQWYSTEDGMKLLLLIHGAFQKQFEITEMSRDKKTHDISITLKRWRQEFIIDFPSNFPNGRAVLNYHTKKREISLSEKATKGNVKPRKGSQKQDKKANQNTASANEKEGGQRRTSKKGTVVPDKEAPAEETPNENDNDNASAGQEGAVQKEAEPPKEPSLEKIPELLVKGIHQILQGSEV